MTASSSISGAAWAMKARAVMEAVAKVAGKQPAPKAAKPKKQRRPGNTYRGERRNLARKGIKVDARPWQTEVTRYRVPASLHPLCQQVSKYDPHQGKRECARRRGEIGQRRRGEFRQ